ncbi:MAG: hypothetical protein HKN39_03455 [Flavobacteriales bacterium]|nr:hypothetical protein [Flavobacteriales bacterium]
MFKKIIKYGLIASVAFLTLTGIGALYVYFNQDEIKALAMDKLNDSINGSLTISNSEASLLSSFPKVSIDLEDPYLISVADTLLACEELRLKLNIFDLIKKDYKISELDIINGEIELRSLENGDLNFEVWKTDTSEREESIAFKIEDIKLKNITINYFDESVSNAYSTEIEELGAALETSEEVWKIDLDGDLTSFNFLEDTTQRITQQGIELSAQLTYENDQLTFNGFKIDTKRIEIEGSGALTMIKDQEVLSLELETATSPNGLLNIFEHYYELPENYKTDGEANILSDLYYAYGKNKTLEMKNTIQIKDGEFIETDSKETIRNISFQGEYNIDNDRSDMIIQEMISEMAHGNVAVNGKVLDIPDPKTDLNFQGQLDLREISHFFSLDSVLFDGKIKFNNTLKGEFISEELNSEKWMNKAEIEGEASLERGEIEWLDQDVRVSDLSGKMFFSKDHIAVQDLSGDMESTTFNLNGTLSNTLNYFIKEDEKLVIEAFLEADRVDLKEFIISTENEENRSQLSLPENVEFKLNSNIQDLVFNEFKAKKLKGLLSYKNKRFDANDISFNSCQGEVSGRLSITEKAEDKFLVTCETSAKDLDIKQVFQGFANFDQDFLTAEHLSGITSSDVYFQGIMDQYLDFRKNTIETIADINLKDGELIQHPAMKEIAAYLRKKKLLNPFLKIDEFEENVRHLSFSELENRIEIKDSKIKIPKMEIKSNAMDANISGVHGFDNEVDYRIDFRMREMLKQHEEEIEEIYVEDDGTGSRIFIAMKGQVDDMDISFDKESARAKRKSDLKKAKEDLFNIFKKQDPEEKKEEKIEIKLEDQIVQDKKKKKKGFGKLFEKEEDEHEAIDYEIIDDEE